MSHEVYQTCLAYEDREEPWHRIGHPFKRGLRLMDACRQADAFVEIVQGQPRGGFELLDGSGRMIDAEMVEHGSLNKAITILRAPHGTDTKWEPLGTSSDRYSIIQNETLAELLQPLEKYGDVDTVGVLEKGALFFVTFFGEEWAVKVGGIEEAHKTYLIVKNSHLPGAAMQFQIAHVRVICKNTWMMADSAAQFQFSLNHVGDMSLVTKWAVEAWEKVAQRTTVAQEALRQMADTPADERDFREYMLQVIPDPAPPKQMVITEKSGIAMLPEIAALQTEVNTVSTRKDDNYRVQQERRQNLRMLGMNTWKTSETVQRGTRLGMYNALTETLAHGIRTGGNRRQTKATMQSVLFGERKGWIEDGFALALDPNADIGRYGDNNS